MVNKNPFYAPAPAPLGGGELGQWCAREFERIAAVLSEGGMQGLILDVQEQLPEKPREGMVRFYRGGVVGVGSTPGCYQFKAGVWDKLGT